MLRTIAIAVVLTALGAAAAGEMLFDWRTPRSEYVAGHALGTNGPVSLVAFGEITKEMKEKYGPLVSVSLNAGSGQIRVEKDGQLLHEESLDQRINSVVGMFLVGPRGRPADMAFAFRLAPDQNLKEMSGG